MAEKYVVQSLLFPMYTKLNENNEQVQIFGSKEGEEEERRHIQKVQNAFQYYRKYAFLRLNKSESYLSTLCHEDQLMLSKYRSHLNSVRSCIEHNQAVIMEILQDHFLYPTEGDTEQITTEGVDLFTQILLQHKDMEQTQQQVFDEAEIVDPLKVVKAQSTLKLIARDWSSDGAAEREQSYKPIIDTIEEYFRPTDYDLNQIKILVPGAGLGRLTYELACRGYSCEGNEFSYFMLIASNFVLNLCDYENKYVLYPWVHQYVNNMRRSDQVAAVRFPDVCPVRNPPKGNIEMAAGDFLEVYKTDNTYNCVATCFFIDCAQNVIDFIRTIYKILVPGGIWVNLGPLLYHYSGVNDHDSIEPTYEDLIIIMESIGFDILSSRTGIKTKYAQNPQSMKQSEYESLFWVCKKPPRFEKECEEYSTIVAQHEASKVVQHSYKGMEVPQDDAKHDSQEAICSKNVLAPSGQAIENQEEM